MQSEQDDERLVVCKNCGDEHYIHERTHRAASSFCPECRMRGGYVLDEYREEFATDGGRADSGRAIVQTRDENAYLGVCTDCGLEDSLPVPNGTPLPDVGIVVEQYICDCGNTSWEVTGYDRLVFQRESRFEQGPDISGTWHHFGELEWRTPRGSDEDDRDRPVCPVSQLGSADEPRDCWRVAERVTDPEGRGAWKCGWHGAFRVFDYPRSGSAETEQATLVADGGTEEDRALVALLEDLSKGDRFTVDSHASVLQVHSTEEFIGAVVLDAYDEDGGHWPVASVDGDLYLGYSQLEPADDQSRAKRIGDVEIVDQQETPSLVPDGGEEVGRAVSQLSGVDAAVYDMIERREPAHRDKVFDELYSYSRDEFDIAVSGLKRDGLVVEVEESLPFHEDASRTVLATEGYDAE